MQVPISNEELDALIGASKNGFDPRTIPLTHASGDHGSFAIESDSMGADWALAQLALLRAAKLHVGGPVRHTGARQTGGENPEAPLAGTRTCENCGNGNFACGSCMAEDYIFPNYGARLGLQEIQTLLQHSGLVTAYGAAQLAAYLDMEAYVLREVQPQGEGQ